MTNLQDQQTVAGFTPEELAFVIDFFEAENKGYEETNKLFEAAKPLREFQKTLNVSEEMKKSGDALYERVVQAQKKASERNTIAVSFLNKLKAIQKSMS